MKKDFSQNKATLQKSRTSLWITLVLFLGICVFVGDFFTKKWIFNHLLTLSAFDGRYVGWQVPIFQNVFGIDFVLTPTLNYGAAWGMFAEFQTLLLIVRICVILALCIYLIFVAHPKRHDIPLVLIVAGASGNVLDFFIYGFVVDFLHFIFWGYNFAVFNLADASITIGVFYLIIVSLYAKSHAPHPPSRLKMD